MSEASEKNAFLTTRSNLKILGLSDESEWKVRACDPYEMTICLIWISKTQEKLKLEEGLRKQLEESLLQLQLKMSKYSTEL